MQPDPYFDGDKEQEKPTEAEENFELPDDLDLDNAGDDGRGEDEGQEEVEPIDIGADNEDEEGNDKQEPAVEEEVGLI